MTTFEAQRFQTVAESATLVVETCPTCHILHAIPLSLQQRALALPKMQYVWCPNGHEWWYTSESDAEKQRKRAEAAERDAAWQRTKRQQAERAEEAMRHSRDGMKGVLAKVKKRVAAGVCPCCQRTFSNLAQHMRGQHPDYGDASK